MEHILLTVIIKYYNYTYVYHRKFITTRVLTFFCHKIIITIPYISCYGVTTSGVAVTVTTTVSVIGGGMGVACLGQL